MGGGRLDLKMDLLLAVDGKFKRGEIEDLEMLTSRIGF